MGVAFVIKGRPLTKKEEKAISEYSKAYKTKNSNTKSSTRLRKVGKIASPKKMPSTVYGQI